MPKNSKSQDFDDSEAKETISPMIGKMTPRVTPLETGPLPDDHPLWTAGFVVGVKLLNPSSRKPPKPEADLIPEQQLEDEEDDRID